MNIEQAIEVLRKRGFEVEDYSQVKYRVTDEEIDDLYDDEESLISYAMDQKEQLDDDDYNNFEVCDTCRKHILYGKYLKNQGLCDSCIEVIN